MRWFYDLGISKKLLSSFILISLISGAMGTYGAYNLKSIDTSYTQLYENMTVPITQMSEISTEFQRMRVNVRDMIIAQSAEEIQSNISQIEERKANIDKISASFEKTIISTEMRGEFYVFKAARVDFKLKLDKAIALAKENKDQEAVAMISENGEVGKSSIVEQNAIEKMISMKNDDAKAKSDSNSKIANMTITIMFGVIIFVMVMSILIGLYISKLITKPLKRAVYIIQEMSKGHLGERLKINTKDEIGQMSVAMDIFADDLQNSVIGVMKKISNGDVSMNIQLKDEKDEISPALNKMVENIRELVKDTNMLSKAAVEGKLDTRADETKHNGDFKNIVKGVNNTLDSVIGPLNVAAEYVERISKGDIPKKITDTYHGDFNEIKNNLNNCIDVMNGLLTETNNLIKATQEGKLDTRGNSTAFAGDWRTLVEGVNKLIDAFVEPINVTAEYIDRISKGDIPEKITDTYYGDFNEIKNNLNNCIDNIRELVTDAIMLSKAATEGKLDTRADATKHSGDFKKIVEGVNELIEVMVKPIQEVTNAMSKIAKGNLEVPVSENYKGEFGVLAKAVNVTEESLKEIVGKISEVIGEISNGNLAIENVKEFDGNFKSISVSLNTIINSLNSVLSEINSASEQVFVGAGQVSDGSQALSQGATEQASSIEELTASITQVAAQTNENATNANQAKDLALKVKENAEDGNRHMSEMLKSMGEINESSANISKIIKVIDEIAFQTNILALNAAVEAARAGQHGKGFAVVAEEVRNLAARSANAAKETTDLIEGSIKKSEKGTEIANNTAKALYEIVDGVSKAAIIVSEIAASSEEQATGISQINVGIEQVSRVIQINSATAEESAAASEELSSQSELLKDMVSSFKLKNSNGIQFNNQTKNKQYNSRDNNRAYKEVAATSNKYQIVLSDNEFGKY